MSVPSATEPDAILSHNHPSGRGPSKEDLGHIMAHPGQTLRVVARNENGRVEIFEIQMRSAIPEDEAADIAAEYGAFCKSNGDTHEARRRGIALISESYGDILSIVTAIA